jgi:hypothetical protein
MRKTVALISLPLLAITLVAGAFGAYEILTTYAGFSHVWGWAAAIAIDLTGLWLALFTTILAKSGASVTSIKRSTWFVIAISVGLNAFHGGMIGLALGGLVGAIVGALAGSIFPIFSAMIFHYNMSLITYEVDKAAGHILTRKPTLPSLRFGDRKEHRAIMKEHAALQYARARYILNQERNELGTAVTHEVTKVQAPDTRDTELVTEVQDVPDLVTQVETVLVGIDTPENLVSVPDFLSPGMNTPLICKLLVEHNPDTDLDTAFNYVNLLNQDEVSRNSVKTALYRAKKSAVTA